MHSSVITFPGSNCDRDVEVALEKLKFKNTIVWHKDSEILLQKSFLEIGTLFVMHFCSSIKHPWFFPNLNKPPV